MTGKWEKAHRAGHRIYHREGETVRCRCGETLAGHSSLEKDCPPPEEGNYSICVYCGQVWRYAKDGMVLVDAAELLLNPDVAEAARKHKEVREDLIRRGTMPRWTPKN